MRASRIQANVTQQTGASMRQIALSIILIFIISLRAAPQDNLDRDVQSKIIAVEKAWNLAYKAGDRRALDALLDDQIVLVNDDGSVQKKGDFLASVKVDKSQEQQVVPESMIVRVFGNTAIASGVFRATGVEGGKPYVRRERFVDTWIYRRGNWVCVATDATPVLH
jgi:ketosteroid isomerase-like protein